MASSRLTWIYGRQDRAKDVPNDVIDEYQTIIRHLYLDQNMTRLDVIGQLKDYHGFTLTTSQFAKATKRWGFYKQPRRAQTLVQTLEETIVPESEPLGAIFDIEVDASGADVENKSLTQTVNALVPELEILKNTKNDNSPSEGDFRDQNNHSIPPSQRQQRNDEDSCKEPSRKVGDNLLEAENYYRSIVLSTRQCQPTDFKSSIRVSWAHEAQISSTPRCSPPRARYRREKALRLLDVALLPDMTLESCSDYLACCYLFQDSFDYIERIIRINSTILADENLICQFLDLMRIAKSSRMGQYAINLLLDYHLLEAEEGDADGKLVLPYTSAQDRMLFHAYLYDIYGVIQGLEGKAQRHFGRLRQIRDELAASPSCSLSMWSILFLQQESNHRDTPGDLLERLDSDDGEFLYFFRMCLRCLKSCSCTV